MIDETSTDRIIGDFLELNASILQKREQSKFPKFISKFIWNNDKKKLLKQIEILRDSNYIMNLHNISELSFYIFNNFDDKKYKSIFLVKIEKMITYNIIETVIKFDNITAIIDINSDVDTFDIKILELDNDNNKNTYNYTLHKMSNNNDDLLFKINDLLKETMCDYIYDIINLYK